MLRHLPVAQVSVFVLFRMLQQAQVRPLLSTAHTDPGGFIFNSSLTRVQQLESICSPFVKDAVVCC